MRSENCNRYGIQKFTVVEIIWSRLESDYEEFKDPQEDDITTEDHKHFYQNSKIILEVAEDADMEQSLRD